MVHKPAFLRQNGGGLTPPAHTAAKMLGCVPLHNIKPPDGAFHFLFFQVSFFQAC